MLNIGRIVMIQERMEVCDREKLDLSYETGGTRFPETTHTSFVKVVGSLDLNSYDIIPP